MAMLQKNSPYAVLEVSHDASNNEIEQAYQRIRGVLAPDSLATYAMLDQGDAERLRVELDEAYRTLSDPSRRARYDNEHAHVQPHDHLFAESSQAGAGPPQITLDLGHLRREILSNPRDVLPAQAPDLMRRGVPKSAAVRRAMQEGLRHADVTHAAAAGAPQISRTRSLKPQLNELCGPDTEYSGALLRRLRESAHADLQDVSDITKISKRYLAAIEDNDFETLPAFVYVRGFVCEYARALGLDPNLVARSYMALVKRYRGEGTGS